MNALLKIGVIALSVLLILSSCSEQQGDEAKAPAKGEKEKASVEKPWIASRNTTRVNTDEMVEAAVLVSQTTWMATNDENRPNAVILVDPDVWQNAVVAANLIHHPSNGPVLFITKDEVPELTMKEIKRLAPKGIDKGVQVVVIGDVSDDLRKQVEKSGFKVETIAGDNPASIAKAVDTYYADLVGETPLSVVVGTMEKLEFTIPAINWIAHMPEPLLYVTKDKIPEETAEALATRLGKANVYVLGPTSVISEKVAQELAKYGKVTRISGEDMFENAVAFAQYKDPATGFGWGMTGTGAGRNFSFVGQEQIKLALAAAPFSHLGKHAPLLITKKEQLPDPVKEYLLSVRPLFDKSPTEGPYNHAWLLGSEETILRDTQGEIDNALEISPRSGSGGGHGGHSGH